MYVNLCIIRIIYIKSYYTDSIIISKQCNIQKKFKIILLFFVLSLKLKIFLYAFYCILQEFIFSVKPFWRLKYLY